MCDNLKIKFQQTLHALDILVSNQRLLIDNNNDDDLLALMTRFADQRKTARQLESQLTCVTLKTKSQSQQILDQRKRRLNSSNRAARLHKTIQKIFNLINYHGQHTSPIDQLHYIKELCKERLKEDKSPSDDDEDELDSHNCTIDDDDADESILMHPRVVLPQSSSKKRPLQSKVDITVPQAMLSPSKRLRSEEPPQFITKTTFECFNTTRPFTITTDIQMIDHFSSTTINSSKTNSASSFEQTLPLNTPSKMPTITHRFLSKKIFKPETCFVCLKRIYFGSVSYRCSSCSQTCHVDCKQNADGNCKISSNKGVLPPHSPKTPVVPASKNPLRQRMINSEPRKVGTSPSSSRTSTIQRRLPFERMMLLK